MNEFQSSLPDTAARTSSERHLEGLRQQGGMFVEAVRVTRMPMVITDPTLPGNPITFANEAFEALSGYPLEELRGQDPHFMNGPGTDPVAIRRYQAALDHGVDETLEIQQYRKDGTPFMAMLFATQLGDGQGRVTHHFLSYLDVTRRHDAEASVRALASELEARVEARTRELEAANARLKKADAEREMLLMEVNHRAKNSLAVAASLLELQARRQTDPAVGALFSDAANRLGAMARLHDLLSRSEQAQKADLALYLAELCEALGALTGPDERIALRAEAEAGMLIDADTAFPVGIILTELITNAVKYAFPPPRSGAIRVQARRGAPGRVEVTVTDDGVGLGEGPAQFRDGSLGYGLVRALAGQIGADLSIRSDAGVRVCLSFPEGTDRRPDPHPGGRASRPSA